LGRDALFWAVLSNAAADGKRLRVIDALWVKKARLAGPKPLQVRGVAAVF
jgi:hypothetical protein